MKHNSNAISQQHIISQIYDAALEQEQWTDVIKNITQTLNAEQGYIRIIDTTSNNVQLCYGYNKDLSWVQAFKDYYVHQDPWLNKILKSENSVIACTHHHISNEKYEAMEYYQDFVRPQKIHYGLGGVLNVGKNITAYLALNRKKENQGFQNKQLENLQFIAPHLQKALLINEKTRHIDIENNLFRDALSQINSPLLLVNKNGKVLFINPHAEKIIEHQTGINIKNDNISFVSSKQNKILHNLIHQATKNKIHSSLQQGGAMNYIDPFNKTSLSILVTPINPDRTNIDTQSDNNVLLLLNANNQEAPLTTELLIALYKLTTAEARLTVHLCQGLTLAEISEKFSLSINTLKTQLRSCFNKVGVSRQAELVRVIHNNASTKI